MSKVSENQLKESKRDLKGWQVEGHGGGRAPVDFHWMMLIAPFGFRLV